MAGKFLKIPAGKLDPGMFLAELDRPWIESPLLFQEYVIEDQDELKWIKRNCAFVMVDPARSRVAIDPELIGKVDPPAPEPEPTRIEKKPEPEPERGNEITLTVRQPLGPTDQGADTMFFSMLTEQLRMILARLFHSGAKVDKALIAPKRGGSEVNQSKEQVAIANAIYDYARDLYGGQARAVFRGETPDLEVLKQVVLPMVDCVTLSPDAMACVVRLRHADEYASAHALATLVWSLIFAKSLDLKDEDLVEVGLAALMLDFGMLRLPRELLRKQGKLSDEERKKFRDHVGLSLDLARKAGKVSPKVERMIECHHERFDGSGYPRGLSGDNIPAMGRMMGLADTYAAMTLTRPGAPANSAFKVLRQLKAQGGVLFEKKLVEVFIRSMGVFPTGSLVELNTGEVAIVVEQNNQRRLRPRVMLVLDSAKQPMEQNPLVNLDTKPSDPSDPESLWILNGMEPGSHGVDPRDYYFSEVSRSSDNTVAEPALQG